MEKWWANLVSADNVTILYYLGCNNANADGVLSQVLVPHGLVPSEISEAIPKA